MLGITSPLETRTAPTMTGGSRKARPRRARAQPPRLRPAGQPRRRPRTCPRSGGRPASTRPATAAYAHAVRATDDRRRCLLTEGASGRSRPAAGPRQDRAAERRLRRAEPRRVSVARGPGQQEDGSPTPSAARWREAGRPGVEVAIDDVGHRLHDVVVDLRGAVVDTRHHGDEGTVLHALDRQPAVGVENAAVQGSPGGSRRGPCGVEEADAASELGKQLRERDRTGKRQVDAPACRW